MPDRAKIQEEVIDKMILAGWAGSSVRKEDLTTFSLHADARECIRKMRDFVAAFGAEGITVDHAWVFFQIISDDTFSE